MIKKVNAPAISAYSGARLSFNLEFVGFCSEDQKRLRKSLSFLEAKLDVIVDEILNHFLSYDEPRALFAFRDGSLRQDTLAVARQELKKWLVAAAKGNEPNELGKMLCRGARMISGKNMESPGLHPQYVVSFFEILRSKITAALREREGAEGTEMAESWTSYLMAQLEVVLKYMVPFWSGSHLQTSSEETILRAA